jgi:hypothetical protein
MIARPFDTPTMRATQGERLILTPLPFLTLLPFVVSSRRADVSNHERTL